MRRSSNTAFKRLMVKCSNVVSKFDFSKTYIFLPIYMDVCCDLIKAISIKRWEEAACVVVVLGGWIQVTK